MTFPFLLSTLLSALVGEVLTQHVYYSPQAVAAATLPTSEHGSDLVSAPHGALVQHRSHKTSKRVIKL